MDGDRRSSAGDGSALYCSNCGTGLEASMNFCPNCGAPAGSPTSGSVTATNADRRSSGAPATGSDGTTDREILEYRIATASRDGWELEHDFGDHAVMVRRSFGDLDEHLVVALVTIWFTGGFGNLLWGAYRYFGDPERIVLRADHVEENDDEDSSGTGSTMLGRLTAAVCWLAAAVVAAVATQLGLGVLSLAFFGLAACFAVMGTVSLPSVRRRLEGRRSITANGRVRSVDERSVVAYDRTCSACADTVGRGVERTYRKEFCVLGVPLSADEGRNYYCRECADGTATATSRSRPERTTAVDSSDRSGSSPGANGDADADAGADTRSEYDRESARE